MNEAPLLAPLGHDRTLDQLKELWAGGAGPRTLLFVGPSSVGRRQAARWLTAFVNCSGGAEAPCGVCESCRLLHEGAHPDLKEVGPSTVTGTGRAKRTLEIRIDQLVHRERGEAEPLAPWLLQRPRFKVRVGVIDHADTMSLPAANSVLKLLEEPPAWSLIVLIAPGPETVIPTVASRSSTVRFRPVPESHLGTLPGAHPEHPALLLGQPGLLLGRGRDEAAEPRLEQESARQAAAALLGALDKGLSAILTVAEEFASAQANAQATGTEPRPLEWLRHELRMFEPERYAAAADAVDSCERALAHYAQASLASAVLALELKRALH